MSRRKGFTLIELLVVIAIIAILAAILFPVFAKAREKARQTSCASNLKQLALAVIMYSGDYDECAPGVSHPWGGGINSYSGALVNSTCWAVNIEPYVKAKAMFKCPSSPGQTASLDTNDNKVKVWGVWLPDDWAGVTFGYAMNVLLQLSSPPPADPNDETSGGSWFQPTMQPNEGYGGKNFAMLKNPAEVMMLSDAFAPIEGCYDKINITETCGGDQSDGSGCSIGEDQYRNPDNARHSGGNNWAFCDGHVKWNRYNKFRCGGTDTGNYMESKDVMTANTLQHVCGVDQIRP